LLPESAATAREISLVIPTYQRRGSVTKLVHALASQELAWDRFEVVIVVDGSTDGTMERLLELEPLFPLRRVWQENRGRAAACNHGVDISTAPIIALLDDDMDPKPGMLKAHLAAHSLGDLVIAVGPAPIVVDESSPPLVTYRSEVFASKLRRMGQPGYEPGIRDVYTGNVSFSRKLFKAAGGFDEDFREYGNEDFELLLRMIAVGGRIAFAPDASAWQSYDKDFRALARDVRAEGSTAVLFTQKQPDASGEMELAAWGRRSLRHRRVLEWLLRASLLGAPFPTFLIKTTTVLERLRPPFLKKWYDFGLDYFYWLGAVQAPGPLGAAFRRGYDLARAVALLEIGSRKSAPTINPTPTAGG